MANKINLIFKLGAAFFAFALTKLGIDTLHSPEDAANAFGLPASSRETLIYMPVWGIRDMGFGISILALIAADISSTINQGQASAAIVTMVGACVGLGDSFLVSSAGGKGAVGHALGASGMLVSGLGLWLSSKQV